VQQWEGVWVWFPADHPPPPAGLATRRGEWERFAHAVEAVLA
jgi:hypothetical protein